MFDWVVNMPLPSINGSFQENKKLLSLSKKNVAVKKKEQLTLTPVSDNRVPAKQL